MPIWRSESLEEWESRSGSLEEWESEGKGSGGVRDNESVKEWQLK